MSRMSGRASRRSPATASDRTKNAGPPDCAPTRGRDGCRQRATMHATSSDDARRASASQLGLAARAAAARDRLVALGVVVVGQLFARLDVARRADPDRLVDDVDPAVRLARVVDEPRDVAADVGVAAPVAVDPEHPDAALAQVAILAALALLVGDELAGVVDDALVLVDGLDGEDAKAVQLRILRGGFSEGRQDEACSEAQTVVDAALSRECSRSSTVIRVASRQRS